MSDDEGRQKETPIETAVLLTAALSAGSAQQGAAANQNDQITQYQLKWSLQAINEVKCTLKLLLGLKKNKLMHCRLVRTANVAFLKMNNTMMPPYETPGLLSDKTIAHLSLTRARANEKTKVFRSIHKAWGYKKLRSRPAAARSTQQRRRHF